MKKWLSLFLCLLLVLSLAACGGQGATKPNSDAQTSDADAPTGSDADAPADSDADAPADSDAEAPADSDAETPAVDAEEPDADADATQIANPFEDYETYADAETAAGFTFHAPEAIGGYDSVAYRVAKDIGLFEIIYSNADANLTARKAPGSLNISGDYNQYQVEEVEAVGGVDVTCWGSEETLFLAVWTEDDYSYSLSTSASVDRQDFMGYVETFITLNAVA